MKLTNYEMSSFLRTRLIHPEDSRVIVDYFPNRRPVYNSADLEAALREYVEKNVTGRTALALSGGIDSAILAHFMPKGSVAYTFKCCVPGLEVTDETKAAARYAEHADIEQRVIEIYWEDFEKYSSTLMLHKGAPIHSIEVQIYKAAQKAREDGFDSILFGEAADAVYGGQGNILSKDYSFGEFVNRYSYVEPHFVLRDPVYALEVFKKHEKRGAIDPYDFMSQEYINESVGSYLNACETANVRPLVAYASTYMACNMDYGRIRSGENKYLVREVFKKLYPDFEVPPKIPMPRPMNEWFRDWMGPESDAFLQNCVNNMNGDQKWLIWALDQYLRL